VYFRRIGRRRLGRSWRPRHPPPQARQARRRPRRHRDGAGPGHTQVAGILGQLSHVHRKPQRTCGCTRRPAPCS